MEKADIQKHVLEYAHNKLAPFTAAIAFDNIDAIETPKQVSDALERLYNQRILARRKIDKARYEYIRAEIRPAGFEMAPEQPAAETKTTEPEKIEMQNKNNIGSVKSAIIGLYRIAELTTQNIEHRQSPIEQKPEQKPDWLKTAHEIVHGYREKTYGDLAKTCG